MQIKERKGGRRLTSNGILPRRISRISYKGRIPEETRDEYDPPALDTLLDHRPQGYRGGV